MKNATILFLALSACLTTFILTRSYDEKVLKEEIKKEVKKEIDEEFENVYHLFIFQARQIENNSNFHHQVKTIIRNLHGEGSLSLIKKENGDKEK